MCYSLWDPPFPRTGVNPWWRPRLSITLFLFISTHEICIGDGALTVNYTFTKTEIDTALDETIFQKP